MLRTIQGSVNDFSTLIRITGPKPLSKRSPVPLDRYGFTASTFPCGATISPHIVLLTIPKVDRAKVIYSGYSGGLQAHLKKLVAHRIFELDPRINYAGDIIFNSEIPPGIWFNNVSTSDSFQNVVDRNSDASVVVASNAGNAPLHDWEINYINERGEQIVGSKDYYTEGQPIRDRKYFCVTFHPDRGVAIEYVGFTADGIAKDPSGLELAVGGRPLVFESKPSPIGEVLKTSLTDPRHVLLLPEVEVTGNPENPVFLPLGLRTIQRMISENRYEEIADRIREGAPILISLEEEKNCLGSLGVQRAILEKALSMFGYSKDEYRFEGNLLHLNIKLNPYRHTFWAQKGDTIFIGIIRNDLNDPESYGGTLYNRALKPFGLTIPQLQLFIVEELGAENAVLMGNGKDPRLFIYPPLAEPELQNPIVDYDSRDSITAGLISLII